MAIQFNLLPDTKLHSLKSQQSAKQMVRIATLVSIGLLMFFGLLLAGVKVWQKSQLANADKEIAAATDELNKIEGLGRILTVQNQLSTLRDLHARKHISSRLFGFLTQTTPTKVQVNGLSLDLAANTLQITGTADSQHSINTFIDALKNSTYTVGSQDNPAKAFTSVVESSFAIGQDNVTFTLDVQFNPQIFSNALETEPQLKVRPQDRASKDGGSQYAAAVAN